LRDHLGANQDSRIEIRRVDFDSDDDLLQLATGEGELIRELDGLVLIYPRIGKHSTDMLNARENSIVWQRCFFRPLELVSVLLVFRSYAAAAAQARA
jgi:hypothetical protein